MLSEEGISESPALLYQCEIGCVTAECPHLLEVLAYWSSRWEKEELENCVLNLNSALRQPFLSRRELSILAEQHAECLVRLGEIERGEQNEHASPALRQGMQYLSREFANRGVFPPRRA